MYLRAGSELVIIGNNCDLLVSQLSNYKLPITNL